MAERIVELLEIVDLREKKLSKVEHHLREAEKVLVKAKGLPDEPVNTTSEEDGDESVWQDLAQSTPVHERQVRSKLSRNYLGVFDFEQGERGN
jgi:hypothetical protein